ncbi:hypothetical protein RhiirA4_481713 [Rhizophagus irregularis]|uniref:Uncharacterized protein n=1 Tax=Rhizophagus irregularis TaxID=588596 RepID=A0A2I1HJZ6_9GLOM|nr:hypothetical protein RhiirA4_481713 [Rhizophagus irregularis]
MAKKAKLMSEFIEFYSKVCVARSIKFITDKASKKEISLSESDQFSHNLATILARNSEVVAVNLKILPNKCRVYISKNSKWLNKDIKYIDKIKELMKNLSKDGQRLNKLKKDIKDNKDKSHIKSFLEFLESSEINVDNLNEINEPFDKEISKFEYVITTACCEYYKDNKNNKNYPQRFLKHIKKVGSYSASVMDIVNYARKEKYKTLFSCIDLHLLDPIFDNQPISSWTDIIKKFIPIQKNFEDFKKNCLKNNEIRERLNDIYSCTGGQLDSVSKKCCYLCELYIKFLRSKGYKITIFEGHKKLYYKWKLPDTYSSEFVKYALCDHRE